MGSPPPFVAFVVSPAAALKDAATTLNAYGSSHHTPSTPVTPTFPFGSSRLPPAPFGSLSKSTGAKRASSKRPKTSSAAVGASSGALGGSEGSRPLTLTQALKLCGVSVTSFSTPPQLLAHLLSPSITRDGPPPTLVAFLPISDFALPHGLNPSLFLLDPSQTPTSLCFPSEESSASQKMEGAIEASLDAIEAVARDAKGREMGLVVVAYSASSSLPDGTVDLCRRAGADLVVSPPHDFAVLKGKVVDAIKMSKARISRSPHAPPTVTLAGGGGPVPRPDPSELFTLSDLSAPFANLCAVTPEDTRRASVDVGFMALTLSRAGLAGEAGWSSNAVEDGEWSGDEHDGAREGSGRRRSIKGPRGEGKLFAELVAEMHQQVQAAINVDFSEVDPSFFEPIRGQERISLVNRLAGWDFKPYEMSRDNLYRCSTLLFEAVLSIDGLFQLEIRPQQINRFLFACRAQYHDANPYHNHSHSLDVFQAAYSFLFALGLVPALSTLLLGDEGRGLTQPWRRQDGLKGRAAEVFRPQDVLALMVAAIGHDAAHPGMSNAFLKNAKAPLSQVYNNMSALENMHCILTVSLLRKHGLGFLLGPEEQPLTKDAFLPSSSSSSSPSPAPSAASPTTSKRPSPTTPTFASQARSRVHTADFKKVLQGIILSTDMAMHFSFMVNLRSMGDRAQDGALEGDLADKAQVDRDRLMLLQALIKCADISNPARPHEVSEHWSSSLLAEWHLQATLEVGLSLPVSVVKHADASVQTKGQISFIDIFCTALFDGVAAVMPPMRQFADSLALNRSLWFKRLTSLPAPDAPPALHRSSSLTPSTVDLEIPCPLDSHYRTLFPLTLPPALLARPRSPPHERDPSARDSTTTPAAPGSVPLGLAPGGGRGFFPARSAEGKHDRHHPAPDDADDGGGQNVDLRVAYSNLSPKRASFSPL